MMDQEDAWMYYHKDVSEKVNLGMVMKTANSVCSALGLTLGHSWKAYLTELPNFPWTNIYLTSLELEESDKDMKSPANFTCPLLWPQWFENERFRIQWY